VVFGSDVGIPHPFDISTLDGSSGFTINGLDSNDRSGSSVSSAGDINGDGIDDLIIGATHADPNGNNSAGSSYVVFGSYAGLPHLFDLSNLNGANGFIINGVNGDGLDDLIIGAYGAGPNGNSYAGSSYVVFGKSEVIFKSGFE